LEKKSERLEVRLGYQEKQNFTQACDLQGDTPSGAVRRFITGYVKRSDSDVMSSVWRGAAKRKLLPFAALASLLIISMLGLYAGIKTLTQPSSDEIFAYKDTNNDGELDASEHAIPPGPNNTPNSVMRVLDIDTSGTISRGEFVRKGRMAYSIVDSSPHSLSDKDKLVATLVNFEFTKSHSKSNTFIGVPIRADGLDRLVIWPKAGGPIVFDGHVQMVIENEKIEFLADNIIQHN